MDKYSIAVQPAHEYASHKNFFTALEQAIPDLKIGLLSEPDLRYDALLQLNDSPEKIFGAKTTIIYRRSRENEEPRRAKIEFSHSSHLDRRLRGRIIHEEGYAPVEKLLIEEHDEILAYRDGAPIWIRRSQGDSHIFIINQPLEEMKDGNCLIDQLREGKFLSTLALVHIIRAMTENVRWHPPGLRASFLLDDPNLHWGTYGYVDYSRLAMHARAHHYHVSFAMIPLDAWYAQPATVRIFREWGNHLSLLIHGNNHHGAELDITRKERDVAHAQLAQALIRISNFEKKYGIPVDRVMAAPHGLISETTMRAMYRLGYEAACISRPRPWLQPPILHRPTLNWNIAELIVGGFPIIRRRSLAYWRKYQSKRDELLLRAFLDQPIVLMGHHDDLARGLDAFAHAAHEINSLGEVKWCSIGRIARGNYLTRIDADTLRVRMYSRRIDLVVPPGINKIIIEKAPADDGTCEDEIRNGEGGGAARPGTLLEIEDPSLWKGTGCLDIQCRHAEALDPAKIPLPGFRVTPLVRRLCTEARDRLLPLVR